MTDPADTREYDAFIDSLTEFLHREIDDYVAEQKIDPLIGVFGPMMAAGVLSMTHSLVEIFIRIAEILSRERDSITETCSMTHPQQPAPVATTAQTNDSVGLGRHLNAVVRTRCESQGYGPEPALVALLTVSLEQAGTIGHLAAFYNGLGKMLEGQYGLLAAQPGKHTH